MVKACRTRRLSHCEAVFVLKTEFSSVSAKLHCFATEKKDCTAIGILQLSAKLHCFATETKDCTAIGILQLSAKLHCFATETKDCTAIGILQLICTKRFLISLYLLNAALEHLNKLSMLFQKGCFNFSHIQLALTICKNEIRNLTNSNHVENSLKLDWNKIAKILLHSQNELLEDDIRMTKYHKSLL